MKKRILIDATTVTFQVDGLSNYIINLIKHLPEASFDHFEYTVLMNPNINRRELTDHVKNGNFKVIERKVAPIGPKRDWDMFWFLLKHEKNYDLIHITSSNFPVSLRKGVCTIHDLTFRKYFDNPKYTFNLATKYMNWVVRNCMKYAKAVIAVSQSTKQELLNGYHLDLAAKEKIHVIYEGWEHLIHYNKNEEDPCEGDRMVNDDYLFYLGTSRKHKNLSNLLSAFKLAMPHIPANKKLAISGSDKYINNMDMSVISDVNSSGKRIYFTGYLSNACVEKYFKNADAYIFPSLSEGFGIPVLEAFYYEKPVLCSNTTSLPEVAGDAAFYFDPHDPQSIANTIINFYNNPPDKNLLAERARLQLKKFSWAKASRETVAVYKNCLGL
ncbi:MAG TPA: glycosyltransferase family 1 protein [Ferruginibacter sp.]|jgi:glycosyltransferase involved in cell wall biosynthesis|nr:glycosyltransferase family 1 protein [Ferruginibacter sp.]